MDFGRRHIVGCGDIGRRVARCYDRARRPHAWIRSDASLHRCTQLGLASHRLDLDRPPDSCAIGRGSHILYTVPPPPTGRHDPRLRAFLNLLCAADIDKFVLISTSGVYGDCGGAWVDEGAPLKPGVDRALRRADAETALLDWSEQNAVDTIILRVPGIYARDRLPLRRLRAGSPVLARSQSPWSNRIHADDLAVACHAALEQPIANEIINVSDDAPSSMTDYFFAVADYAGLPRPPEISLHEARRMLGDGMLSYLAESRRIDNTKMKSCLGISLQYPTLARGLALDTS